MSGVLVIGLLAVGASVSYDRQQDPQSYAEQGCSGDGPDYVACVDARLRDGVLTPGALWFIAALVGTAVIAWLRWNTRDQRAPDVGAAEQALSGPETPAWDRDL